MTISKLFSSSYLLDSTPAPDNKFMLQQLIVFGVLILVSIVYLLIKKLDVKIRYRFFYCFLTAGILGLIYVFSRYQSLPWLGSRIYLLLVILMLAIWTIINTYWLNSYLKKLDNKQILADRYEKYLPKQKNKA